MLDYDDFDFQEFLEEEREIDQQRTKLRKWADNE